MPDRILTIGEAVDLSAIIKAATSGQTVIRLFKDLRTVKGIARSIGDREGNLATKNDDIRDCYLRVTHVGVTDYFWLISELLLELREGTFVTNYQ